jgi:proteasome lid subunit RPN8/RPN11
MTVYLSETAFLSIILSSVEAYKKECYGLILGFRTETQWRVEYAVPYQTAARGHTMVTPHGQRDRRVRACLGHLSNYEQLGTFHSHPAWGRLRALAKPSKWDADMMPPGDLDIIVAVNDAMDQRRFHLGERGRVLTGTVSDFELKLAAYYKPPIQDLSAKTNVHRTLIRCPYALGFEPESSLK